MGLDELWSVARAVIDSIESDSSSCMLLVPENLRTCKLTTANLVSNESLSKLFTIFPQNVLLAALDLVDTKGGTEFCPFND